jgi:hypothetical protein
MSKPSETSPSNSPEARGRYRPPRRESIEDHLTVARKRLVIPYGAWTDKTATVDWVLDLHKQRIINGPKDVAKAEGPGRGKRYDPRDYRDLLTVIGLKCRGIGRRSAWIAHLWLRGHDYPIECFRAALLSELRAMRRDVIADFAPRGLSRRMNFRAQYARYKEKRAAQGNGKESALFDYLAAWQIAPNNIHDVVPDVAVIAVELNKVLGKNVAGLEVALSEMFTAIPAGTDLSGQTGRVLGELFENTGFGCLLSALTADADAQKDLTDLSKRLRGTIDDGRAGTDTSSLISTAKKASEADFVRIRRWYRALGSGQLEGMLRSTIAQAPPVAMVVLEPLLAMARVQREVMHVNPVLALHIYACMLQSDVPIELLETNEPIGYREVMNVLRDQ